MCQTALFFSFPMGNTARFFVRGRGSSGKREGFEEGAKGLGTKAEE